ncbi:MAG: peptidylprolyl isomerase [Bacteroidetes bacterium]|nr:peptidylprolyl isomerase [Bacteroidota bacterium]MCY4205318.1 peptidylprolyl isomerase [Bacteroidota bacterium]
MFNHPRLLPLSALLLFIPSLVLAQENVVDEIVAIVGENKIILRSEIDGLLLNITQQQQIQYSDELWYQTLQQLVDQEVLAEHARRDTNIVITEDQVDQSLDQRIGIMVQQLGSESRLEEIYGQSIVQIRDDLRDEIRGRLLADQFRSMKLRNLKVTPTEIREWFAQFPTDSLPVLPPIVRVSHIVKYPEILPEAREEALEIVTAIRDSITTERSTLEEMARRYSEDTGSAQNGGRYESMQLGDLVPEFAAIAARITPGELSQPFQSPFGFHILRVNQRVGDVVDFSHVLINIDRSRSDPSNAIKELEIIRDSILTYDIPFELMASRHSEEDASSEIGGRIVDPNSGERDLFVDALGADWKATTDTLEVGEISHPSEVTLLDGTLAWHLVLLQRKVPTHRINIETDYSRIETLALENKRTEEMRRWLDLLREEVFIEFRGKASRIHALLGDITANN